MKSLGFPLKTQTETQNLVEKFNWTQIRNLLLQVKMIKQRKNAGTYWDKKEKATKVKQTIQLKEINQNVQAKEGRLKRY